MQTLSLNPRRSFRRPGEGLGDKALIVASGLVAIYSLGPEGKRRICAMRFPGEVIMPQALGPTCGVQALTKAEVVLDETRPDFDLLKHERIAHEWIARLSGDAAERMASLLCELALRGDYGVKLPKLLSQQQMGEITGQTSVNVNRVLADFDGRELIRRPKGLIELLDLDLLMRLGSFRPEAFQ